MHIEIRSSNFDPFAEVCQYQHTLRSGSYGANTLFVGTMRDFNFDDTVKTMHLEHYPHMTEKQLKLMVDKCMVQYEIDDLLLLHRIGDLSPGEAIVLVSVWSAHRQAAFESCRQIMEHLKNKATFWKKEMLEKGTRWVKNTPLR